MNRIYGFIQGLFGKEAAATDEELAAARSLGVPVYSGNSIHPMDMGRVRAAMGSMPVSSKPVPQQTFREAREQWRRQAAENREALDARAAARTAAGDRIVAEKTRRRVLPILAGNRQMDKTPENRAYVQRMYKDSIDPVTGLARPGAHAAAERAQTSTSPVPAPVPSKPATAPAPVAAKPATAPAPVAAKPAIFGTTRSRAAIPPKPLLQSPTPGGVEQTFPVTSPPPPGTGSATGSASVSRGDKGIAGNFRGRLGASV